MGGGLGGGGETGGMGKHCCAADILWHTQSLESQEQVSVLSSSSQAAGAQGYGIFNPA
jgi:hypothetical protein